MLLSSFLRQKEAIILPDPEKQGGWLCYIIKFAVFNFIFFFHCCFLQGVPKKTKGSNDTRNASVPVLPLQHTLFQTSKLLGDTREIFFLHFTSSCLIRCDLKPAPLKSAAVIFHKCISRFPKQKEGFFLPAQTYIACSKVSRDTASGDFFWRKQPLSVHF